MRLATHIQGRNLYARLHLLNEEKSVLREHRELLDRRVLDLTPRQFEIFYPGWITTLRDLLGQPYCVECGNPSAAHDCRDKMLKAVAGIEKEVAGLIPPPPPVEPVAPEIAECSRSNSTAITWT